ncbi:MAG: GGDEF domain-containing protein [Desulfamplus sp.]|nr:GGDEF domain-containing protein [Desulfamplus sp.]
MQKKFDLQHEYITIESLFESMPVAMALIDREGRHVALNQALASFSGLSVRDLVGRKVEELSKESGENIKRDFLCFDAGEEVPDHEVQIGDKICFVSVKPVLDKSGFTIGEMVALTDITRNKEVERQLAEANKRLQFLANHDSLTSVLNARTYYEVCDQMMCVAHRDNVPFSVLFLDLDHFKNINDTYGHDAGDIVLKKTAACILENCRKCDVVGRVGGEEFSIYLPETDHNGALILAEKLRAKIEELMLCIDRKTINITASIGVSSSSKHHKSIADIQRDADHAMYHAKKEGRNRVSWLNMPCYVEQAMTEQGL